VREIYVERRLYQWRKNLPAKSKRHVRDPIKEYENENRSYQWRGLQACEHLQPDLEKRILPNLDVPARPDRCFHRCKLERASSGELYLEFAGNSTGSFDRTH
jgi:hypothetical protein